MKHHRGLILVISAPSGAGKTTVIQRLLRVTKTMKRSISTTTRPPRGHERNGRDYFFVTKHRFQELIRRGAFAEWAKVHEGLYGTTRRFLDGQLKRGYDVVLNIDVQGGRSIFRRYPKETVLVFLQPPSWKELVKRLVHRGDVGREVMRHRLKIAKREIAAAKDYQYMVVNDRVEWAVKRVKAILEVERFRVRK